MQTEKKTGEVSCDPLQDPAVMLYLGEFVAQKRLAGEHGISHEEEQTAFLIAGAVLRLRDGKGKQPRQARQDPQFVFEFGGAMRALGKAENPAFVDAEHRIKLTGFRTGCGRGRCRIRAGGV